MNRKPETKPIRKMRAAELDRLTAEFDKEFVADTFASPSSEARARWVRAKRNRGRPRQGKGVKAISVCLEEELLKKSDRLARKMGVSRSRLIARGLLAVLAAEKAKK